MGAHRALPRLFPPMDSNSPPVRAPTTNLENTHHMSNPKFYKSDTDQPTLNQHPTNFTQNTTMRRAFENNHATTRTRRTINDHKGIQKRSQKEHGNNNTQNQAKRKPERTMNNLKEYTTACNKEEHNHRKRCVHYFPRPILGSVGSSCVAYPPAEMKRYAHATVVDTDHILHQMSTG